MLTNTDDPALVDRFIVRYIDGAAAVLTQDIIINNVISAIEKCGLDGGANAPVANMKVTAQTIAGATL